jgi:DNA-binding winged helix-turn-helix (wHTH) protein
MQFVFGDYRLDLDRRELSRSADAIAVGPQVFDLLVYLVRNRERVVSKDELLDAVWDGRIISESTL